MNWNIEYYAKENGEIPVLEFMLSLEPKMRAKVKHMIDLLGQCGTNLREPYVAPIKGDKYKGLWELRVKFASDITRVFYFTFQGNKFVLLHGIKKKTQKTPPNELERALRYKAIVPVLPKAKLPLGLSTRWEILTRRLLVSYRPHL